jgi:outer membrane receptor protein involved in Fe transport
MRREANFSRFVTALLTPDCCIPNVKSHAALPAEPMPTFRAIATVLSLLALCAGPRAAQAQKGAAALVGWIHDSAGAPVGQADILVQNGGQAARTDSTGRFVLRALDPGAITVLIRRFGYDPQTFEFVLRAGSEDSVSVTMLPRLRTLAAMRTEASPEHRTRELEGFNRRRAQGSGAFITRADIERNNTGLLSESLREVPGLRFVRAGAGRQGLRFDSAIGRSYDCQPLYWVDGVKVLGAELDDFPPDDVEAIELYKGPATTPAQFAPARANASCGTVVIWTRIPGKP